MGRVGSAANWFLATTPRPNADVVLLGFPHAGGGCSSLAALNGELAAAIELRTMNLPGRQARYREPNRTDLAGLVTDLAEAVPRDDGRQVVLFGYCSGALLAYLVADAVRESGVVTHLLVASYPAPDKYKPLQDAHLLPSEQFWNRIVDKGGIPVRLADNAQLRPLVEPSLRADFELFSQYLPTQRPPLDIPVTTVEGRFDETDMAGWSRMTTGGVDRIVLDSGRWIVTDAPAALAEVLTTVGRRHGDW